MKLFKIQFYEHMSQKKLSSFDLVLSCHDKTFLLPWSQFLAVLNTTFSPCAGLSLRFCFLITYVPDINRVLGNIYRVVGLVHV